MARAISVADSVTAVPGKRQLVGEGWSLRAERVEMLNGNDWRALVGARRGL
jgi:predicted nucleotide-binding protein (sugar kinase/HSP70/actin superfamily)